ncbi:serine/threonine protein kinase [Desulfonispora thiosulfatigenes DSM 11270]|uniref:non-specific serine/threonine protein kinase n=1 Tax=Desulfonispora thiosulfatigenes DSM 11270 TaxID=656914 RepID=A0A1W1VK38_DESTI|nr:Stk1 family PASTA domain-containing Ser/Thr kinase [Desulfonispora thiosulfatigenes]SMB93431.1 serine/threonine protein kinase [Desulfonispora thiosulfatigenes DSM 11270]
MIGKNLGGRYQILSPIGEGGMSVVYKAKDLLLSRLVAVKVLREQFTSDNEFVKRFRREAQAAASLSHANIVGIYDVGQDENLYYLVMEYIEGENLKEIIKEKGMISQEETIYIVKQICDALEHAHKNDLVHRDIKPHNILINKEGLIKVTDFGIARAVSAATVTHTKGILGSVHYFSPEQAKGEIAGHKSDIYSLGILLYEMITGQLPFEGDSPISIALQHIQKDPIKPREINPNINQDLENVILKCIAKDSNDRYESFSNIKNDLQDIHEGKLIQIEVKENKKFDTNSLENTIVFSDKLEPNKSINNKKKKKKIKPTGYALIIFIGLILLVGSTWSFSKLFIKQDVIVPDVQNLTVSEGKRLLKDKKLNLEIKNEIEDDEVPEGRIISQDPLPDAKIKSKRTVMVIVSKGVSKVLVPDIVGYTEAEAEIRLTNKELEIGEITNEYNDEYPIGRVINQYPRFEDEVTKNSKIDLVISKGSRPNFKSMISLIGLDLNVAEARILEQGLVLSGVTKKPSNQYGENIVFEQDPAVGGRVKAGTKVNLIISSGTANNSSESKVAVKLTRPGNLIIEVSDANGEREVYNEQHQKDDVITKNVTYNGQATITVYLDDEIILQKNEQ